MSSEEALAQNSLTQSIAVQQAFEKLKQVEDQLTVERTRFRDETPTIVSLKSKQAALKALLEDRTKLVLQNQPQVSYESLQKSAEKQGGKLVETLTENLVTAEAERQAQINQLASLIRTRSVYEQRVSSLPKLEQIQRELQRQLDAAQESYKLLLKNREEVRLAENPNLRVLVTKKYF
jgi:uncharacterized protein involved in exopolysaccharide biosynthesis